MTQPSSSSNILRNLNNEQNQNESVDASDSAKSTVSKQKKERLSCKLLNEKMEKNFAELTKLISQNIPTFGSTSANPSILSGATSSISAPNRLAAIPSPHFPLMTARDRTSSFSFNNQRNNSFNDDSDCELQQQQQQFMMNRPQTDFYISESLEWNAIPLQTLQDKVKQHLFDSAAVGNLVLFEFLYKIVTDRSFHEYNWLRAQVLLFERGNHLTEDEKKRCLDTINYRKRGRRASYYNNKFKTQNYNSSKNPTRPRSQERAKSQPKNRDFLKGSR